MLLGKYLNKYYLRYFLLFFFGIVALVAVDTAQLYTPEFLGEIVDSLSSGKVDSALIADISVKLILIAFVMLAGRMAWRFTLFNASQRIEAGLRREMFLKSERLSQRYYHESKIGSIMSWFTTDLETIEEYLGFGTVQMVDAFFLGVLVIIRMLLLDWALAVFAFIPMILIIIWGALVEKYMALKWEQRQKEYDRMYDFTQESFTGVRVIKAFVKETAEIHAFAKIAKKNKDTNISFVRVSVIFDNIIELIIAAIMALILGFGSWFVFRYANGQAISILGHAVELSPGDLITFTGYFDTLVWPLIALGSLVTMKSRATTSLKRITDYLDQPEEVCDSADCKNLENVSGKITFSHFDFTYPGSEHQILKDVSLTIQPGEIVGIVGRTGCGKSTLVSALLRLYNLPADTVLIDDQDVMACSIASVRDAVAYVPQDNFLFSDTISGNISFADADATDEKIREAAVFADVAENIDGFKDGYQTLTGERGVTLSGGQKQRISLARAYMKNAPILVLDDSVSAVDVKTEETILNNIRTNRAGKTTLVVASRVSTVSTLDKIIVLNDGRLEAFGTPSELMEISPTYQKMVYLQELEREVNGGEA